MAAQWNVKIIIIQWNTGHQSLKHTKIQYFLALPSKPIVRVKYRSAQCNTDLTFSGMRWACHSDKWRATHSWMWIILSASIIPLANCYYHLVNLGRNLILKTTSRETIEDNKHTWMDLYSVHINKPCSNQPLVAKMYKPACKLSLLLCEQYFVIFIWSIVAEM